MRELSIGLVPIARTTFDIELAGQMSRDVRTVLQAEGVTLVGPEDLVTDLATTQNVAEMLSNETIDLLLVFQASFADSSMIVALVEKIDAPVLMWAVPEERTGGRLRLNSLCGINLAGHALRLRKKKYEYIYASPNDPEAVAQIKTLASAGRVQRLLSRTRVGVLGEYPSGFDTCRIDEDTLRSVFGIEIELVDQRKFFEQVKKIDNTRTENTRIALTETLENLDALDQAALNGTLQVYNAMKDLVSEKDLASMAVRCWPEFFTELGCAACGAMSMMNEDLVPCTCEADMNGTVTQLILQWLSNEPVFGTDLVAVDYDDDIAVFWHCGKAPLSMADPAYKPRGGVHSNRKVPLVMEFPLKPGAVTILRISQATGRLRMVVGLGEVISAPPSFSGTSGVVRFERSVRKVLDTIIREGLEHHVALTYGDYIPSLLALARMLDLEVLEL
jgi:L-fucose isomerase-like protein